jgi:hypothetical protein
MPLLSSSQSDLFGFSTSYVGDEEREPKIPESLEVLNLLGGSNYREDILQRLPSSLKVLMEPNRISSSSDVERMIKIVRDFSMLFSVVSISE